MRYYIIEVGCDMIAMATVVSAVIKAREGYYVMYEVSDDKYMSVEEITADAFATHHAIAMNKYFEN